MINNRGRRVKIAYNTYTGDNNANHAIAHSLGIKPKMVLIQGATGRVFCLDLTNNFVTYIKGGGNYAVTAADTANFYVGNAGSMAESANTAAEVYNYFAIG